MPTINQYSFSNVTYIVPENSNVSGLYPTAVITLTPEPGYTLDANNFALDTNVYYPELQSVSFSQSGVNVICTVVFATNFVMPSNNVSIPLCIIGEGILDKKQVSGSVYNIIGPDVNGDIDPVEDHFYTYYSNSGVLGETDLVFTKSFEAVPGYYLDASLFMTHGNQSNYTVQQLPTYDVDGNLTAITYNVYYIYPNYSSLEDEWTLKVAATEIYVAPMTITSYLFDTSYVSINGETRDLYIYGSPGAVFSVTMNDSFGNSYPIATNITLGSSGEYIAQVVFPNFYDIHPDAYYEIELIGDIDPNFQQPNPIEIYQASIYPTISITGTSSNDLTGFNTVSAQGLAFEEPLNLFMNVNWTLTSATSEINYLGNPGPPNFKFTQEVGVNTVVTANVTNSSTISVVDATGLEIGDKFNTPNQNINLSPFAYEITNIVGNTLTLSNNITAASGDILSIYRTNGNIINNITATATVIDPSTINLSMSIQVMRFGNDDITFALDLDEIIGYVTPPFICGSTANSGGQGITDMPIPLNPTGGLLAFLLNGQGIADKFEIIHGTASGTKVSTSSMILGGNNGPFDNVYGTEPTNLIPNTTEIASVNQFIGTDKGAIPPGLIEFTDNTGYTIGTMTVGGVTYQQVIWWAYDAADYIANPIATLRVTGTTGTSWDVLRICCPDSNCIPA